jgi:predicted protein tyrosine phosphatase
MDGIEVSSAGTSPDAECVVSADLLDWAHQVFVMEKRQRRYLQTRFAAVLKDKKIVCLGIPDIYSYMQPELIALHVGEDDPLFASVVRFGDLISL